MIASQTVLWLVKMRKGRSDACGSPLLRMSKWYSKLDDRRLYSTKGRVLLRLPPVVRLDFPGRFSSGSRRRLGGSFRVFGCVLRDLELWLLSVSLGGGLFEWCSLSGTFLFVRFMVTGVILGCRTGMWPRPSPRFFSLLCSTGKRSAFDAFLFLACGPKRGIGTRSVCFGHTPAGNGWSEYLGSPVFLPCPSNSLMGNARSFPPTLL